MMYHRLRRFKPQITQIIILATCYSLLTTQIGCDAFRKKFVRKSKEEKAKEKEVIFTPEQYPRYPTSVTETYQMHFTIWESWQSELLQRFEVDGNQKKWLECIDEEAKNLEFMKDMITSEEKRALVDTFIQRLSDLRKEIDKKSGVSNSDIHRLKSNIELLGREIHRELSYSKVKEYLVQE